MFEPIEITWKGEEKTVPADKVMRVLGNLEDQLTFIEANTLVVEAARNNSRKQVKVATVYASFLKSCGYRVTPEDVINTLDFAAYVAALMELVGVLKLTLAPIERERYDAIMADSEAGEEDAKPEPVAKKPRPAKRLQKKPSKP